jgi:hypothetical protein
MFGHCKYQIELTKELLFLLFHVHMDVELRWDEVADANGFCRMRILYTDDEREIHIAGRGLKNLVHKSESKARSMLQRQNNNKFILLLSLTEIEKKQKKKHSR